MSSNAFSRYAPYIQDYIYRKGWTDLRQVQTDACQAILDTPDHVIIASGTASGKTEAAFFPVLTLMNQQPGTSISVLYVGPLKALINDQFDRLRGLLEEQEIPVFPWHGDISASVKQKAMRAREGIVQITPESLEALLMKHSDTALRMFSDLQFIVIDELHVFMGTDRGEQLRSLLVRLQNLVGIIPRRIALSATLADYQSAMEWLQAGTDRKCVVTGLNVNKRNVGLGMECFLYPQESSQEEHASVYVSMVKKIYDLTLNKKCIVFTNSRKKAEELTASLKRVAEIFHTDDVYYVHHSSVAAPYRRETENVMKMSGKPAVVCATNTLELGIDVGDLDLIVQYGAPYSCSSFVQRLGRSGRRTGKPMMYFVHPYYEDCENTYSRLPWDLLRSLAIVSLYAEEKYIEPFVMKPKPFSLLAHQTLSLLYEHGELLPRELAAEIFQIPGFKESITREEYLQLLRYMVQEDYLEQTETKTLIPGLKGEQIASFYTFYAVFESGNDWQVYYKDLIGTISEKPEIGSSFVLNGKAWQVTRIHKRNRVVYVEPSGSLQSARFTGKGADIHPRIVQKMREILGQENLPPFLRSSGAELVEKARRIAKDSGMLNGSVYVLTVDRFLIVPWCGTKTLRTLGYLFRGRLEKMLKIKAVELMPYGLYVESDLEVDQFIQVCHEVKLDPEDPSQILSSDAAPVIDAWDELVDPELRRIAFLKNQTDIESAQNVLQTLKRTSVGGE